MANDNRSSLPLPALLVIGAVAVIVAYFLVNKIAVNAATSIAAATIKTEATKAAATAVQQEVVKEDFIDFIVNNVKREALPEITADLRKIAAESMRPIDDKYTGITDQLDADVQALISKTDTVISNRISALEKADASIRESLKDSDNTISDFINLSLTGLVPAGAVSAFYCEPNSPPGGWLACNGKTISDNVAKLSGVKPDEKYGTLVRILTKIGYGVEDGVAKLPDLQGLFLRGVDDESGVGEYQDDTIKKHRHPIYGEGQTVGITGVYKEYRSKYRSFMTEIRGRNMPSPRPIFVDTEFQGESSLDHGDFSIDDANETRPKNASIVWCIKY